MSLETFIHEMKKSEISRQTITDYLSVLNRLTITEKQHAWYYRDSNGLEVDAVVQKRNGDWLAFNIKLGTGPIEETAANLKIVLPEIVLRQTPALT